MTERNLLEEAARIYSHAELAKELGYARETVSRWYNGRTNPGIRVLEQLDRLIPKDRWASATPDFTFIDLFAGIGGLRIAFERAGGKCVFTSEINASAHKTYRANHFCSEAFNDDIRKITRRPDGSERSDHEIRKAIGPYDVLVAGFPCQPFSIAGVSKKNSLGQAHGFACDTQGTLFFDLAKVIKATKPKAFLLENVKNLRSHDRGKTWQVIRGVLEDELGYTVAYRDGMPGQPPVFDAKGYVPQHRERVVLVGFREPVGFSWNGYKAPPSDALCVGDILESPDKVDPRYTLSDKLWTYLKKYADKHKAKGNGFGYGKVTPGETTRTLSARYYKDGSEILVDQGRRNPRRLTPRECSRLMGFDAPGEARFKIPVSDTQAYKQFGNAVAVPLFTAVAQLMRPHILELIRLETEQPQIRLVG